MDFATALFAIALAPGAIAAAITLSLQRRLLHSWFFFLVAVLVMYGAYTISHVVLESISASGSILVAGPATEERLAEQALWFLNSRIPALLVASLVGIPTLLALSKRLSRL